MIHFRKARSARLPGSLNNNRMLNAWLRIDADGTVTIFTGKIELGQGIGTALAQIAADELDVDLKRIRMVHGDTALTPNEGQTAGSLSVENSGSAVRFACAEAREMLLAAAAAKLGTQELKVVDGTINDSLTYWTLAGELDLKKEASGTAKPKPASRAQVGRQEHSARRYPEEVHRRRRLRAGHPPAGDAVRPRGTAAIAGGAAGFAG